jgi:hypothetical protein
MRPHVAGERGEEQCVAVLVVAVEELVRAHADGEERGARLPGDFAGERSTAAAGAQVISSVVLGVKCAAYSRMRSKTGRQRTVAAIGEFDLDGAFQERIGDAGVGPTMSRVRSLGAFARRSHQT